MGLNFYIGEVQAQANQASQMNNQASQAIQSLQTSIQSFLSAPLSSKAYDSAKSYFMVAYTPLCQSAIMTGEALESANKRLLSDYQSMVCGIDTIEDEILEQITRFEEVKRDLYEQIETAKTLRPDLERRYHNVCESIEKRQDKLEKFHEYNTHSATIFSDFEASEAEFSAGLAQVANCKAWNPATGTFDMTRLNMSWAKPIHTRWTKREKMRQEKLKKIQGKLDEEVIPKNKKELFENYYWSTNANAWISKKTGKPVPELSGVASKIMRTEPPKMNNDLLEYYNKMVTTGIDPLTGRRLTNSEIQQARLMQIATALTPAYQSAVLAKLAPEIEGYGKRKTNLNENIGSFNKFNIDKIRHKLQTDPDSAFFWSGRTNGVGGADVAANVAKNKGGVTLESTIDSKKIQMPEWDFNNPDSMKAWDLASGAYAEQVSGEVRAVIGSELREGNIWENVELPRLKNNPDVTKITTIDPVTGIEKIIFERK